MSTGAVASSGTIPVSIGLLGTDWALAPSALVTMVLAVAAATFLLAQAGCGGFRRPWLLGGSSLLYLGYVLYLYGNRKRGISGLLGIPMGNYSVKTQQDKLS